MPYIPYTPKQVQDMLEVIGVKSINELFDVIPKELKNSTLNIPSGKSEYEVLTHLKNLAQKNRTDLISFLGAGFYDHYIPAPIKHILQRSEFYTAYTPYQPEASQGTLQAIFEYQTAMARLMEMDFANASLYDGGTAIYEAMMMAVRITKRKKIIISETVNPIYRLMLQCYTKNLHLELVTIPHQNGKTNLEELKKSIDQQTACIIVQNPSFFGELQDYSPLFSLAQKQGALSIISVYALLQSILKTPGEMGADIAVAEGQSLGLPLNFGGPYLGILTTRKKHIRQMPGRVVGKTTDKQGQTGFVLTLQAREQHIRREKATSNICSNQALCAFQALLYIAFLGPEGLKRTAEQSIEKAHYAAQKLTSIPGVKLLNDYAFANEFALTLPVNAFELVNHLTARGFIPGFPLGRYYPGLENCLLLACTEKRTFEEIGILTEMIKAYLTYRR
ncbi:MAG: aminomethyl-transferring glycine dehydrogenase subunit GcvPA [Desulfonauticus sp.]|nr:aminomethyl-transferring glycine dehydrogenase subunit GcvPA [Desulfonauticus sp.]